MTAKDYGLIVAVLIPTFITLRLFERFIPHHRREPHNDVAGFIFATVSVVFAVPLAFVVVALPRATNLVYSIRDSLFAFHPTDSSQQVLYDHALTHVESMAEQRRERLNQTEESLPPLLWRSSSAARWRRSPSRSCSSCPVPSPTP